MLKVGEEIHLTASDLVGHLNCHYLTRLDLAVANGTLVKPKIWDPVLEVLVERGNLHEKNYIDHLRAQGFSITQIDGVAVEPEAVAKTLDAMKAGVSIIVQGALQAGRWRGRVDVLRRIEEPSVFGSWSYEVIDTKLARETKGGTVLQICLYSDLLAAAQQRNPDYAQVVVPESEFEPRSYRVADYAAYFRRVKRNLENAVDAGEEVDLYPDPNPHCQICRWRDHCDDKRHADDHLSLVAGISKSQIGELKKQTVMTMAELAAVPLPLQWKPERGAVQSYEKVREQARIQVDGRTKGQMVYETLPVIAGFGLAFLPEPSLGDVFFDFEGDPHVREGGLEYLFGYALRNDDGTPKYIGNWVLSRTEEKVTFEHFVDFVMARWEKHPDLHVYHYAPYEPAALKRLMGRYATRENEIDRMLRAGLFVDLYAVVRHGIRASVESYSIKDLEPLYDFERSVALPDARRALARIERSLELDDAKGIEDADRAFVQNYNRDDCFSTWQLRDWFEELRTGLIKSGVTIDRPAPKAAEASEDVTAWQQKIYELTVRLTHDVPTEKVERNNEQHARWLLANILDFHRREDKAAWWEYFQLSDLSAEDLLDERSAISGLRFAKATGGTVAAPIHRYNFPEQDTDVGEGDELRSVGGENFGTVDAISFEHRTIDIKKRKDTATLHPEAVFSHKIINSKVLANALVRIAEYVLDQGIAGTGDFQAARDLLLMEYPRIGGQEIKKQDESTVGAATRIATVLDGGVFPVQGPPGAGKTHTGARMICTLVQSGKRVGVTANSHKVIRNLLDKVVEAADELSVPLQCIQKPSEIEPNLPSLQFTTDNDDLLSAIGGDCHVAGATAWFWARPDAFECVDVLFIDEAAQMSLANVLAVSQAAKSIVLLGDPRQLEQPLQGSHPDGTDVSALDHILGVHATIPPDRGLFLEETWRLHPEICNFTSELFYESRLSPRGGLERQAIKSKSIVSGSGLRFLPVAHEGNQSSSPEEAETIRELVARILGSRATWTNSEGSETAITLKDILIIAPYNAQVSELQQKMPGARIGTVDKFQGQEAPIVIYSMTTSSHADAPRGMEFLYSSNRLNVATSRARCVCVIVGSPSVFEAECRTPHHIRLANAFCRYLEMAEEI